MAERLRIAFVGLPLAAVLIARDGHDIVYAGLSAPNAIGTRRLRSMIGEGRLHLRPELNADVVSLWTTLAPDLLVSWFWTQRVPEDLLSVPKLGAIGVHPSLLPKYRGPDPYFAVIDGGEAQTGVTVHALERDYDTGALYAQQVVTVEPGWNSWQLARRLDGPSIALLRGVIERFASGQVPQGAPQDESKASYAPIPSEGAAEIDWKWPAPDIVRRIRALSPWPGAFFRMEDETFTVTRAEVVTAFPKALVPGEAAVIELGGRPRAVVRAGHDAVALVGGRTEDSASENVGPDEFVARVRESQRRSSRDAK